MSVQQNAGVVLPAACAVAASFDPALARSVGAAQGQAEVDPNIARLRRKLNLGDRLHSVRQIGYMLEKE